MGTDATALERQVTSSASLDLCKHRVAMATLQPRDAMAADGMGTSRAPGPGWTLSGPEGQASGGPGGGGEGGLLQTQLVIAAK